MSDDGSIKETIATLFSCDAAVENIQPQIEAGRQMTAKTGIP